MIALLAAWACSGQSASPDKTGAVNDRPAAITAPERNRGIDACTMYVEHLCACAKIKPELAESCELKHAKPEALALALGVEADPSSTRDSILRAQREARKIIALCIEEAAQLPTLGCP
jgi:hypothetical protein